MPRWKIEKVWEGQRCFIIGGGPSLTNFNWNLLHSENTIGCNTAFTLGEQVCKVCIFGDARWWNTYQFELAKFKGTVFTNSPQLLNSKIPWLWTMPRESNGLHTEALGWNGNTGASAINLALLFGVKQIYLLGYDMKRTEVQSNWHNRILDDRTVRPSVYNEFAKQFRYVHFHWKRKFADIEIFNVTKDSGLSQEIFPWVDPDSIWPGNYKVFV